MRRNRVSCYLPLLSLLAFLVLTLIHCSSVKDNPMAPAAGDESMSAGAPKAPGTFDEDDALKALPGETLNRGDVRIEARGWDSDGGQRLWVEIPDPTEYVFDFGPDGVKFSRPVRIEISLKKADLAGLPSREIQVYYLSEGTPVPVSSETDLRRNVLTFWVKHFSRYALSRE